MAVLFETKKPITQQQMDKYREIIQYGIGYNIDYWQDTFESAKAKLLIKDILSIHATHITVEGGKRGGKDVIALWAYANYLMLAPDKYHLVTGTTVDHAIRTVAVSDGFGLQYLLPHGMMTTENNRRVFRFLDFYGFEKELHFFAGRDNGDSEAFRGFSYGSHYANEAIQQHINTIKEGAERTISSKWRKIIHTQNPLGVSSNYYEVYENPLIAKDDEIKGYKEQKRYYLTQYKLIYAGIEERRVNEVRKLRDKYFENYKVQTLEELFNKNTLAHTEYMRKEKNINKRYQDELNGGSPSHFREFVEWYANPNRTRNGLYFRYHHFTLRDNLSVSALMVEEVESEYEVGSVRYKRDILGLRASVDGAIWDTFSDSNIYDEDLPNQTGLPRYLSIDYGMANDFVILDITQDDDNTVYVEREIRFIPAKDPRTPTNALYAEMVDEVIQSRENGEYVAVIVDPSARPFINELYSRGINVIRADNTVSNRKDDDKARTDKNPDKQIFGIWLVRDGFATPSGNGKRKIMINRKNTHLIDEIMSYVLDSKKLEQGLEVPMKIKDHGCLVGETLVHTKYGLKPIKDIQVGELVYSFDGKDTILKEVVDQSITLTNAPIWEVELENGEKIQGTYNHPFLTKRGWVQLCDLTEDDVIILGGIDENNL